MILNNKVLHLSRKSEHVKLNFKSFLLNPPLTYTSICYSAQTVIARPRRSVLSVDGHHIAQRIARRRTGRPIKLNAYDRCQPFTLTVSSISQLC